MLRNPTDIAFSLLSARTASTAFSSSILSSPFSPSRAFVSEDEEERRKEKEGAARASKRFSVFGVVNIVPIILHLLEDRKCTSYGEEGEDEEEAEASPPLGSSWRGSSAVDEEEVQFLPSSLSLLSSSPFPPSPCPSRFFFSRLKPRHSTERSEYRKFQRELED
ncbi:hypothetical protein CSUI_006667 [Cystoisospora suis]|uniref:Uncharacterized protein n=1 Tax=Cystoisospora suis TaxID=483139 RepID=A0A2C6KT50_9APIC|nr:hypothetical protein CSUI_006667 [Cystoisospora suis]